jgi:hypothetical protein
MIDRTDFNYGDLRQIDGMYAAIEARLRDSDLHCWRSASDPATMIVTTKSAEHVGLLVWSKRDSEGFECDPKVSISTSEARFTVKRATYKIEDLDFNLIIKALTS